MINYQAFEYQLEQRGELHIPFPRMETEDFGTWNNWLSSLRDRGYTTLCTDNHAQFNVTPMTSKERAEHARIQEESRK